MQDNYMPTDRPYRFRAFTSSYFNLVVSVVDQIISDQKNIA